MSNMFNIYARSASEFSSWLLLKIKRAILTSATIFNRTKIIATCTTNFVVKRTCSGVVVDDSAE